MCIFLVANIIWRSGHAIRSSFLLDFSFLHHNCRRATLFSTWLFRQKWAFRLLRERKRNWLYSTDRGEPSLHIVRRNKILWQQKRTQQPILKVDFAIENKTQTRQTKHSVTGIFGLNLDLNTAGKKPSLSVFVVIFVWCTQFSFWRLNRTRNFHLFSTTRVRCINSR